MQSEWIPKQKILRRQAISYALQDPMSPPIEETRKRVTAIKEKSSLVHKNSNETSTKPNNNAHFTIITEGLITGCKGVILKGEKCYCIQLFWTLKLKNPSFSEVLANAKWKTDIRIPDSRILQEDNTIQNLLACNKNEATMHFPSGFLDYICSSC